MASGFPGVRGKVETAGGLRRSGNWDEVRVPSPTERARIEYIDEVLRKARARGNVELPTASDLAAALKVTRQTIYSTIENMRNDWGLPIELVSLRKGYCYTEDVVGSVFAKFSESEVLAVYLSHEMMSAFHGTPMKRKARSAFRKIIEQCGEDLSFDAAMVEEAFSITPSGHPAYFHPDHFEAVCRALLRREELVLDYTKMHGEGAGLPEQRRIQPIHMTFYEFAWYVLARDTKRQGEFRCFMLTRINAVEETGVRFMRPEKFDAREYLRKNFGIFTSGEAKAIELEFSPKVGRLVMERRWRKKPRIAKQSDGRVRLSLQFAITPDLVAWIAGYLDDCRVLGPAELREEIGRRQAAAALGNGWETAGLSSKP